MYVVVEFVEVDGGKVDSLHTVPQRLVQNVTCLGEAAAQTVKVTM
jgi:hypothetical protein